MLPFTYNCSRRVLTIFFILQDPKTQLTYENVLLKIEKPFDSDRLLLRRIHAFLERHGFINFGIFKRLTDIIPSKVPIKVIVIGAGISVSQIKEATSLRYQSKIVYLRDWQPHDSYNSLEWM